MRQFRRLRAVASLRHLFTGVALFAFVGFGVVGCGKDEPEETDEKAAEGEECSVDGDCKEELLCRKSTCIARGNTVIGENCESHADCNIGENIFCRSGKCDFVESPGDAGIDVNVGGDAGDTGGMEETDTGPGEDEDYYISYVLIDETTNEGRLRVYDTADGTDVAVSPETMNCGSNCWLSRDANYFVYTQDAGGTTVDIYVAEVGEGLQAKGAGEPLVEGVEDVSMLGNHVTYRQGESDGKDTAWVKPVSGGEAETVASVGGDGDWYADPDQDVGIVYSVGESSQSMTIEAGQATSRDSDSTYTLGGPNFQEESGAYFGGNVLTTSSPDGRVAAFVTFDAPNDYEQCTRQSPNDAWSSQECNGDLYYKCGTEQKCTRLELTVHFVDTENRDNLGERCDGGPDACGPIHECYVPSDQQLNEAECIPGRVVLGVPNTKQGKERETSGCEIIQEDDSIDFTGVRGPLSFDSENNLYLVGLRNRECFGTYDIPSSHIVRVNPREGTYEKLEGLPDDKSFDGGKCWNSQEQELEIDEECLVFVQSAQLSPKGREIAYTATNPNTSTPAQAQQFIHLWHMRADGSGRWFTGDKNTPTTDVAEHIRVHPKN